MIDSDEVDTFKESILFLLDCVRLPVQLASIYFNCTNTVHYAACYHKIIIRLFQCIAIIINILVCSAIDLMFTALCYPSSYLPIAANEFLHCKIRLVVCTKIVILILLVSVIFLFIY